jgi:hypothetical protein
MHPSSKFILSIGCAMVAAGLGSSTSTAGTMSGTATTMLIHMHQLNGSGQDGTARLTAVGNKVSVSVSLTGEPASASEPAHVHFGRCPNIKAVPAYNVGPVVHGKAKSIVDLTWAEILSGKYVVNVHQSVAMLGRYMSCGNIGK